MNCQKTKCLFSMSWSERFRLVAKKWNELDAAASLLEELKSSVLSQWMLKKGDVPVSHAERAVKASDEWVEYITKMVAAREAANLAKAEMEFVKMKQMEQQSAEASRRAEMRL